MSLIKISVLSIFTLCCLMSAQAARFTVVNNCRDTVWPAALPGGGVRLDSGQTWNLDVPAGTQTARIWGRTGCNFDPSGNGHNKCQTGDCNNVRRCMLSGDPPTTLAEFTLNGAYNKDYINLSVIDGFNLAMQFSGCGVQLNCKERSCPDAFQTPTENQKVHACPGGTDYRVVFCP